MKVFQKVICFSSIAVLSLSRPTLAADVPLPAKVLEQFSKIVKTNGGAPLVGLTIGPVLGAADPRAIRVPMLRRTTPVTVCFSAQSMDGRYWASSTVTEPPDSSGFGVIQPDSPWKYLSELAVVPRQEFAVLAVYGPNCNTDPSSPYLPLSYNGPQMTLTAAFNVPGVLGRPNAMLFVASKMIEGSCEVISSARRTLAFNVRCRLSLEGVSFGRSERPVLDAFAKIQLNWYDRMGRQLDEYAILLPTPTP